MLMNLFMESSRFSSLYGLVRVLYFPFFFSFFLLLFLFCISEDEFLKKGIFGD